MSANTDIEWADDHMKLVCGKCGSNPCVCGPNVEILDKLISEIRI